MVSNVVIKKIAFSRTHITFLSVSIFHRIQKGKSVEPYSKFHAFAIANPWVLFDTIFYYHYIAIDFICVFRCLPIYRIWIR